MLFKMLTVLVEDHGLHRVVEELSVVCLWKSHHLKANRRPQLGERWRYAGNVLAWNASMYMRELTKEDRK
jgi:hypothetical protein